MRFPLTYVDQPKSIVDIQTIIIISVNDSKLLMVFLILQNNYFAKYYGLLDLAYIFHVI